MLSVVKLEIPIHLPSFANIYAHWSKVAKQKKVHKQLINLYLTPYKEVLWHQKTFTIKFTRVSPRQLDDDNLVSAFKHIRDAVTDFIRPGLAPGRADSLECFTFAYAQEKGKSLIRIEITH